MVGELNETEINNILSNQAVGRIACTDGKHPYIVPAIYGYDGKYIYGQTNDGEKLKILRKNPNVCFETDRMTNLGNWQSVLIFGSFEELEAKKADSAREILFGHIFPQMTSSRVHTFGHEEPMIVNDSTGINSVVYRIKIKKMTGRFEKQ